MAFVTNSNRPQPLWQPPPTACLTASEVLCLLLHPCPPRPHKGLLWRGKPPHPPVVGAICSKSRHSKLRTYQPPPPPHTCRPAGESAWQHPADAHFKNLVAVERLGLHRGNMLRLPGLEMIVETVQEYRLQEHQVMHGEEYRGLWGVVDTVNGRP